MVADSCWSRITCISNRLLAPSFPRCQSESVIYRTPTDFSSYVPNKEQLLSDSEDCNTMTTGTIETKRTEDSAASQMAALTARVSCQDSELAEKDEIISALTDRLELVAEQLDRVKRSGADRGPRGVPQELVVQQEETSSRINALFEQFDGIDIGHSFHRIEVMVGEVRDLIEKQALAPPKHEPALKNDAGPFAAQPPKPQPNLLGGWDSIKSQLLGDSDVTVEEPSADEHAESDAGSESTVVEVPASAVAFVEPPPIDPLPEGLPEPVDFETAERDQLVSAIEVRDKYINLLTRRVEDRRRKLTVPTNWDALAQAPEELLESVHRLHDELNDAVRTAEVDICLERARLSRERTHLEQLRAKFETSNAAAADGSVASAGSRDEKSGRWRRMLGLGEE